MHDLPSSASEKESFWISALGADVDAQRVGSSMISSPGVGGQPAPPRITSAGSHRSGC